MFSSAHDLARFGLFHLRAHLADQKPILRDEQIEEMHRRTADDGKGLGYGIGFMVYDKYGYHFIAHTGGMGGVTTHMRLFPQQALVIVVLCNSGSDLPGDVADRVSARLLPQWELKKEPQRPADGPLVLPDHWRGRWEGTLSTYVRDVPIWLSFQADGEVHAKLGDQLTALVNEPRFKDGVFSGKIAARIGTPDTDRYTNNIYLRLKLRGSVLAGSASAIGVDGPRVRNALTHWVELRKAID